ncbi:hypothetical protein BCR33DRAFT_785076 [Rhizoclosmatium globosum]|uniref:Uncharacterized protein n=1 Tax=Rhizoclosmatium globosum TaxID=329046 RepID=A0A1Y2CBI6_9FUNG|nr:hypothetical protein BCR33DRAFT_785076 [Rhizoclosmatium globosum]|eukprot:ORY44392.1 hypothetical protein BCR33DRAFT_785076 [Rhizoclosmatium globosum]
MDQSALIERISTLSQLLLNNQQQLAGIQEVTAGLKQQLETAKQHNIEAEANGSSDAATRVIELQRETRILNHLIKQYEATIEVIMTKFRLQTVRGGVGPNSKAKAKYADEADRKLAAEQAANEELRQENIRLQAKLQESIQVMRLALLAYDDADPEGLAQATKTSLIHTVVTNE